MKSANRIWFWTTIILGLLYIDHLDTNLVWGPLTSLVSKPPSNGFLPIPTPDPKRPPIHERARKLKKQMQELFPRNNPLQKFRAINDDALDRLADCDEKGTCNPSEYRMVVLGHYQYMEYYLGARQGEHIWTGSQMDTYTALNYTQILTLGVMESLLVYQTFPELINIVVLEQNDMMDCIDRDKQNYKYQEDPGITGMWQEKTGRFGCIKTDKYLEGLPIWKIRINHLWGGHATPMGPRWTLAISDIDSNRPGEGNYFLGYSVQRRCTKLPVQKERKHRAFILAKLPSYFTAERKFSWHGLLEKIPKDVPKGVDPVSSREVPFSFLATAGKNKEEGGPEKLDEGGDAVINIGRLPQEKWWHELSLSKVMIGIGDPVLSPSPYDAMCFGVPFINPIGDWRREDPDDWRHWGTQHQELIQYGPPYVYHVRRGDYDGLRDAIQGAIENPIEGRFIPPAMTIEAVTERHRVLVEKDWFPEAKQHYNDHLKGKPGVTYIL